MFFAFSMGKEMKNLEEEEKRANLIIYNLFIDSCEYAQVFTIFASFCSGWRIARSVNKLIICLSLVDVTIAVWLKKINEIR